MTLHQSHTVLYAVCACTSRIEAVDARDPTRVDGPCPSTGTRLDIRASRGVAPGCSKGVKKDM